MKNDLDLKSKDWKEFSFLELFNIKDWYYNKKPIQNKNNVWNIPFLWATKDNNWITEFYNKNIIEKYDKIWKIWNIKDLEKRFFEWNCIAITNNGSVWHAYYQKNIFTCSHDITPIYLKNYKLNIYIANFLILLIERAGKSFEYAKKWRPIRMRKSKILLPIDKNKDPDWDFMENYMKNIEKKLLNNSLKYYKNKLSKLNINENIKLFKNLEWGEFEIWKIFNIKRWKRFIEKNRLKWKIPYYSASNINNGLTDFIKNPLFIENNKIIVTTFCNSYYVESNFTASDEVTILWHKKLNKNIWLFVSNVINSNKHKFDFWRKAFSERLKKQKIILPLNKNKNPDWNFMENYMKNIEREKLVWILNYYKNRI